jgi:hypothetical protein
MSCRPLLVAALASAMLASAAHAEPGDAAKARPGFRLYRYDEDWRPLCDPAPHREALDALKCLRIAPDATLSIGGDLRARLELARNPGFALRSDDDHALLARAHLDADFRAGSHFRTFVEFGFSDEVGRVGGPTATDIDRGDLTQGFIDVMAPVAGGAATVRAGRQEIGLGSSRLISVRDGPNLRRSFDGVRGFWARGGWRADGFYLAPVRPGRGTFDDGTNRAESIGGVYLTAPLAAGLKLDLYALDYRRDAARFASGSGDERRHSVGARLFGAARNVDWNVEGLYQWGRFGARGIAAWTLASDTGYTFARAPLHPRIGLRADIASGDRGGAALATFNALYPKLPYFSEANLVAPANFIDLHPEVQVSPARDLKLSAGWNLLWRETTHDAVYASPLVAIPNTAGRAGRYTGQQAIAGLDWQPTPHVVIAAQYVHFAPGQALRTVNARSVDFLFASVAYRF